MNLGLQYMVLKIYIFSILRYQKIYCYEILQNTK